MSNFLLYLKIQAAVFVCGIVGPIFLFGYFLSYPRVEMRWMYWWGLIITFADVLIAMWLAKSGADRIDNPPSRGES